MGYAAASGLPRRPPGGGIGQGLDARRARNTGELYASPAGDDLPGGGRTWPVNEPSDPARVVNAAHEFNLSHEGDSLSCPAGCRLDDDPENALKPSRPLVGCCSDQTVRLLA